MASLKTRRKDKTRARVPEFSFTTRELRGVKPDTKEEREEKDRLVREFLARKK